MVGFRLDRLNDDPHIDDFAFGRLLSTPLNRCAVHLS